MDGDLILTMFMLVIFFSPIIMIVWFFQKAGEEKQEAELMKKREELIRARMEKTPPPKAKTCSRKVDTNFFTVEFYDEERLWQVHMKQSWRDHYEGYTFSYDDVAGLDVRMQDRGGKVSTFSLVSRALVGSALGGDAGAILGGMTARESQYVGEINFVVQQNRRSMPEIVLPLTDSECAVGSGLYNRAVKSIRELETGFRLMNAKD